MAVFEYTGLDRALYGFLLHGSGIAPFTMHRGEFVDFGDREPPEDGCWGPAPAGAVGRLPDNHPDYRYPDGAHDPRPKAADAADPGGVVPAEPGDTDVPASAGDEAPADAPKRSRAAARAATDAAK